jgi:hypothetical protein
MKTTRKLTFAALALTSVGVTLGAVKMLAGHGARGSLRNTAVAGELGAGKDPRLGRELRWDLSFQTRLDQSQPGGKPVSMQLQGEWVTTVAGVGSDGSYDVAYAIENARISGEGVSQVSDVEIDQLRSRLAQRFFVTHQADGAATHIYFRPEVDPGTRNLLQLMVTQTQLVRPPRAESHWTATERDGTGTYLAAYQETSPGQITKTKLRYLQTDGVAGLERGKGSVNVGVTDSTRSFALDGEGHVISSKGGEVVTLGSSGGPGVAITVTTGLAGLRATRAPSMVGALEQTRTELVASAIITHALSEEQAEARRDRTLIEGTSLAELLVAVDGAKPNDLLATRLAAVLRQHPEEIPEAVTFLRTSAAGRVVSDALGSAGTPAAQAALCRLAHEATAPARVRGDALTSLVLVKRPTAQTMASLIDLLDAPEPEVRRAALLIQGALARAGREQYPEAARAAERALLARAAPPNDVTLREDALAGLGNSASADLLPAFERALADADPRIRAAAARALRAVADARAEHMLAQLLERDQDPSVRAAAILAASFRPLGALVEPLAHTAETDPVDYVRIDAVALLKDHVAASPRVVEALATVAKNDRKPGIRRLAAEALARR